MAKNDPNSKYGDGVNQKDLPFYTKGDPVPKDWAVDPDDAIDPINQGIADGNRKGN